MFFSSVAKMPEQYNSCVVESETVGFSSHTANFALCFHWAVAYGASVWAKLFCVASLFFLWGDWDFFPEAPKSGTELAQERVTSGKFREWSVLR